MKNLTIILLLLANLSYAQDSTKADTSTVTTRPFQLSLLYPVGSNGVESYKYANNTSLNLLFGLSAGVKGFELAGFGNGTKGDVTGGQIAGFMNINSGNVKGYQMSGFFNAVNGETIGGQTAGFLNLNKGKVTGAQLSGFANINLDSTQAIQATGFYNQVNGTLKGGQIAGFANLVTGNIKGTQISGFANYAHQNVNGLQFAGFTNYTKDTIKGIQLAGFFNYAKKVEGFQIGFINYCDTISKGVPISFLSIVKNGYRRIELEANETLYGNLTFKTGVKSFYNIFTIGIRPHAEDISWGFGYGIGTLFDINNKFSLNLDATASQISYKESYTEKLNLMNKLRVNIAYKIGTKTEVFG